jgi:small-conductance mechanosensitive channel
MNWNLFSPDKLTDPSAVSGALCLAVGMAIAAIVTSKILTRILTKPRWVMGRLQRKVDETAVRYIIRVKTLGVFIASGLIYTSLVPSFQGLMGAMVASAGITAIVAGFAARSTLANLISGLSLAIYRPFRIGDRFFLDGEYGTV